MLALASATRAVTLVMKVFHFALEKFILVTRVVDRVEDFSIVLLFRLRGWETGINILRDDTKLLVSSSRQAREVRFFEWSVLIQGTAHEISAVGEIGCPLRGKPDAL